MIGLGLSASLFSQVRVKYEENAHIQKKKIIIHKKQEPTLGLLFSYPTKHTKTDSNHEESTFEMNPQQIQKKTTKFHLTISQWISGILVYSVFPIKDASKKKKFIPIKNIS